MLLFLHCNTLRAQLFLRISMLCTNSNEGAAVPFTLTIHHRFSSMWTACWRSCGMVVCAVMAGHRTTATSSDPRR